MKLEYLIGSTNEDFATVYAALEAENKAKNTNDIYPYHRYSRIVSLDISRWFFSLEETEGK